MPQYEFLNKEKNIIIQRYFRISERPDTIEVDGETYEFIISMPYVQVDSKKPKTVGALAEKNTEQMIKRGEITPQKKERPFWRKSDKVDKSLAKLTPKQAEKYILTGKK